MFKSLITAFSLYSRLPVPKIEWEEKNLKYVLWWFPMVGLVHGLILWGLAWVLSRLNTSATLFGVVMCAASIMINGGIHMDGFLDTVDALNSFADKKRRLEILKDPHIGAFGVIYAAVYLLVSAGVWSALGERIFPAGIMIFTISRTLSGVGLVMIPPAKKEGSGAALVRQCDKRNTRTALVIMFILQAAAICLYVPVCADTC